MITKRMLAIAAVMMGCCTAGALGQRGDDSVYLDNVVVLLDASGSMGETMSRTGVKKIDAAKTAIREVLRQVSATTHVGLLVFSGKGATDWVYPLGPRDDARLAAALAPIGPHGGTPLGKYIKIGADELLKQRAKQFGYGTYRLLIVTDGEANDADLVDRYTPELVARGITVDVIGVDMKQDHTLARLSHSYRRADDPESLKQAIAEVFAEVGSDADDADAEEAFAVLAGIPDELAAAMLGALATTGNEPIGRAARPGDTARRAARPAPSQIPVPTSPRSTSGSVVVMVVFVIAIVVGLAVVAAMWAKRR